jgi:hypothetical protein
LITFALEFLADDSAGISWFPAPGSSSWPGKTIAGQIEAVAIPWFDIISHTKDNPTIAYQISPERWKEIVAGAFKRAMFDEVILTPRSGDFGRDVIAVKNGISHVRIIDQVKALNQGIM